MRFKLKKRAAYKYSMRAHSQPLTRAALFMITLVCKFIEDSIYQVIILFLYIVS